MGARQRADSTPAEHLIVVFQHGCRALSRRLEIARCIARAEVSASDAGMNRPAKARSRAFFHRPPAADRSALRVGSYSSMNGRQRASRLTQRFLLCVRNMREGRLSVTQAQVSGGVMAFSSIRALSAITRSSCVGEIGPQIGQ